MTKQWDDTEIEILRRDYPAIGLVAVAELLSRSIPSIRAKASNLGLKQDRSSEFFREWQRKAAKSKVGKKRPGQSLVMKRSHAEGKLKRSAATNTEIGKKVKQHIAKHGHPRGALGMKHKPETLKIMGEKTRAKWARMTDEEKHERELKRAKTIVERGIVPPKHGNWKSAWRTIGGKRKFFRSRWEANYARWLQWQKDNDHLIEWEHEPETFWFDKVKRGTVSYLPDFKVSFQDGCVEYHEVKGWMDAKSKTKIRRMKKYHPDVTLVVIDAKAYKKLASIVSTTIAGWE